MILLGLSKDFCADLQDEAVVGIPAACLEGEEVRSTISHCLYHQIANTGLDICVAYNFQHARLGLLLSTATKQRRRLVLSLKNI